LWVWFSLIFNTWKRESKVNKKIPEAFASYSSKDRLRLSVDKISFTFVSLSLYFSLYYLLVSAKKTEYSLRKLTVFSSWSLNWLVTFKFCGFYEFCPSNIDALASSVMDDFSWRYVESWIIWLWLIVLIVMLVS